MDSEWAFSEEHEDEPEADDQHTNNFQNPLGHILSDEQPGEQGTHNDPANNVQETAQLKQEDWAAIFDNQGPFTLQDFDLDEQFSEIFAPQMDDNHGRIRLDDQPSQLSPQSNIGLGSYERNQTWRNLGNMGIDTQNPMQGSMQNSMQNSIANTSFWPNLNWAPTNFQPPVRQSWSFNNPGPSFASQPTSNTFNQAPLEQNTYLEAYFQPSNVTNQIFQQPASMQQAFSGPQSVQGYRNAAPSGIPGTRFSIARPPMFSNQLLQNTPGAFAPAQNAQSVMNMPPPLAPFSSRPRNTMGQMMGQFAAPFPTQGQYGIDQNANRRNQYPQIGEPCGRPAEEGVVRLHENGINAPAEEDRVLGTAESQRTTRATKKRTRMGTPPPRKPRSRRLVLRSDPHERLQIPADPSQPPVRIGRGLSSGRNMLAIFGNDGEPRTRFPLIIERGRSRSIAYEGYPPGDAVLAAQISLAEICRHYPNHVWGTMLRIFMAEGWTAERVWRLLPSRARKNGAAVRKWNYLQAAYGRETDAMEEEDTGEKRVVKRRKTKHGNGEEASQSTSDSSSLQQGWKSMSPAQPEIGSSIPSTTPSSQILAPTRPSAAALPTSVAPQPRQSEPQRQQRRQRRTADDLTLAELQQLALDARDNGVRLLRAIQHGRNPGNAGASLQQRASGRWQDGVDRWAQDQRVLYAQIDPAWQDPGGRDPIPLMTAIWRLSNGPAAQETLAEYGARAEWNAWRMYVAAMQGMARELEQEVDDGGDD